MEKRVSFSKLMLMTLKWENIISVSMILSMWINRKIVIKSLQNNKTSSSIRFFRFFSGVVKRSKTTKPYKTKRELENWWDFTRNENRLSC